MTGRLGVLQQVWRRGDRLLFVRIFAFAAVAPVLARLTPARLQAILAPRDSIRAPDAAGEADRIARLVDAAIVVGRPLIRPRCTTRGLTLYYFLNRRGIDAALDFGVEQFGERLAGHCWLVKDGAPFLEASDPTAMYATVFRLPGLSG